jgi:hypothetical protein
MVMGNVCRWLHSDESDTEVARTFASELEHVTPAQTYAVATMAVKYLCPPEKGKLDGYLRRCVCLGPLHEGDRAQRPDLPGRAVANSCGGVTEASIPSQIPSSCNP